MSDQRNDEISPFPACVSDEAAFALSEALHWLALACDEKYYGQIQRYLSTRYKTEPVDPQRPWLTKLPHE